MQNCPCFGFPHPAEQGFTQDETGQKGKALEQWEEGVNGPLHEYHPVRKRSL